MLISFYLAALLHTLSGGFYMATRFNYDHSCLYLLYNLYNFNFTRMQKYNLSRYKTNVDMGMDHARTMKAIFTLEMWN